MHGLSSSAQPAQFSARHRWFAIVTVFACVVFPAAARRRRHSCLRSGPPSTPRATPPPGRSAPSRLRSAVTTFPAGVTDNSFTGFNNAVFAPPLPASDSVNFLTTLSRFIYTITFDPAVTDPRLHLFSLASVLNFIQGSR